VRARTNRTDHPSRPLMRAAGGAAVGLGLATVLGAVFAAPAAAEGGAAPATGNEPGICIIVIGNSCPPPVSLPPTSAPPSSAPPSQPPPTTAPPTEINQPAPSHSNQLIANSPTPTAQAQDVATLPNTGSDLGLVAGVGAALAGTGAALVVASRRRAGAVGVKKYTK
jgi:endoglucanase